MKSTTAVPLLVSTDWLAGELSNPAVRIVDASSHLPAAGRDALEEYRVSHIPGAVFFDINEISDRASDLPHMLPGAGAFARDCGALGIGDDTHVVVYDSLGLFSAARVWWMLRTFGHPLVSVLDGGFPKWLSEERPVTEQPAAPTPGTLTAQLDTSRVRGLEQMLANLATGTEQMLDARGAGRFHGTEPEPRAGMRSGHIPGSLNAPYSELMDPDTGTLKSPARLRALFEAAGVKLDSPVITTCGSGVTACALALGLALIEKTDVAVYDGSWSEWGAHPDTPID